MRPDIHALIVCPACRGELSIADEACCTACGASYPLLDGVPILMPNAGKDFERYRAEVVSDHPYAPGSLALLARHADGLVLDLGAGGKDFTKPNVVQLDIFKFTHTDVVASADALPFRDGTFDAVVSQAVFEHLKYPDAVVREIARVCKPGAEIKIDTAFLQPEHGYPNHYFNATMSGLKHWFRHFDIVEEAVEDYQHPMYSLHWFLISYLDGVPVEARQVLSGATVAEVVAAIDDHGAGRLALRPELIAALTALGAAKRRELAAGVSILARLTDPLAAQQGGGQGFAALQQESRVAELEAQLAAQAIELAQQQRLLLVRRDVIASVESEVYQAHRDIAHYRDAFELAVADKDKALAEVSALVAVLENELAPYRKARARFGRLLGWIPGSKWLFQRLLGKL
ncbi:methyltransferase domain-containing protein [Chitinimonas sp.]|uniref:methyltransferase domain-containing protein n=1 Tax=Chitinimonas sp. TaxID=1934313 RepID=UPI0035B33D46